jgi:flavodoxin
MKTLVTFYSRTGLTKKVAEAIREKLNCEVEEIIDTKNRRGPLGYMMSGRDAMSKKETLIKETIYKPGDYDMVIIGTPVWAWNVSAPVRTYLNKFKGSFKKTAFFCTMEGSGHEKTFAEMENICGVKPEKTWAITDKEILSGSFVSKIEEFIADFK